MLFVVRIETKHLQFRNSLIFHSQSIHKLSYLYMYLNEDQILIDAAVKSNGNGNYLENKYIINIKIPIKKTQN